MQQLGNFQLLRGKHPMRTRASSIGSLLVVLFLLFPLAAAADEPARGRVPTSDPPDQAADQAEMLAKANAVAREIHERTRAARETGNALNELEALRELRAESSDWGPIARNMFGQVFSILTSQLGNYASAIQSFDEATGPPTWDLEEEAPPLDRWSSEDAVEALADLAGSHQVIMINEAHHVPDREHGQASHLAERILANDPQAKILVHAGFGHINESGSLAGRSPMAAQFQEMTGIDPLTVDQTVMTARASEEFEHPIYRQAVDQEWVRQATLFRRDGEIWSFRPNHYDVSVFHPRPEVRDGRPQWLRMSGSRFDVHLPDELSATRQRLLVRAMSSAESPDAIPLDQVELVPGEPLPVLVLPEGDFTVHVEDASGESVKVFSVLVAAKPSPGPPADVAAERTTN